MAYKLLGKNFTPPDLEAKVTGEAKYSEDIRVNGMVFCRLLTSPMPHARIRNIDISEATKMEGVLGVLLPEDIKTNAPPPAPPILTTEPQYVGQPILAVAALDETTAEDAMEKIRIDYEPLPFTVDPLQSLFPGGPNARADGNVGTVGLNLQTVKWTAADFASAGEGRLPMGKPAEEWAYGDLDAEFKKCKVVYDETFVTASNSHHSMEPRSTLAYWENGKCFIYGSTQSQSFVVPALAGSIGIKPDELVYIAELNSAM